MRKAVRFTDQRAPRASNEALAHMTAYERDRIEVLQIELSHLQLPRKPPGPFNLYLMEFHQHQRASSSDSSIRRSNHVTSDEQVKALWYKETPERRAHFEDLAKRLQDEYLDRFEEIAKKSESVQAEIDTIIASCDKEQCVKRKKVSPFRVFRRDVTARTKEEYPEMGGQERQMIVKAKWERLTEAERTLFVVKARVEEERNYYNQV